MSLWLILPLARADPIDDLVRAAMARDHIPGVTVGIVKDGKLVVSRGFGLADLEAEEKVVPETAFLLASMSKQFTAAAILILAEEGKLSIDDPVSKHVEGTPSAWAGVTLRHLLGHQSGVPEIVYLPGYDFYNQWDKKAILAKLAPLPLDFTPGERFRYSSAGYYLLGWTVERVTGRTLAEFVQERIFRPAGMDHTRYFRYTDIIPRRAHAYAWHEGSYVNEWSGRPTAADGSGAVVSTIFDWAKWDAALDAGFPVSKAIQAQMSAHGTLNDGKPSPYGFGLYDDGEGRVHHTGGSYGFSTAFIRDPRRRVTVVVLRNAKGGPVLEMAKAVLQAFEARETGVSRHLSWRLARTSVVAPRRRGG